MLPNVGDTRLLTHTGYDEKGEGVDHGALTLTVTHPDGTTTTPTVADYGGMPGSSMVALTFTAPGFWSWEWVGTGGSALPSVEVGATLVGLAKYPQAPWCSVIDVLEVPRIKKLDPDYEALYRSTVAATEFLHSRTWRRFRGLREVELRPCCFHAYTRLKAYLAWPMAMAATGLGIGFASNDPIPVNDLPASCGCSPLSEILLPEDVQLVTRVLIDGEEFDGWRLDGGRRLTRTDDLSWPCCADVQLPETEPNTFSVHAVVGEERLEIAREAAIELSIELYLALRAPEKCSIPTRITSANTQGGTWTRVDTSTLGKDGMLGLRLTDIFLSQFGKRRRRALVGSPDTPDLARRKGEGPL